jgi:hypothetical protein
MKPLVTIALSIFFFATKAQIKNIFVHDTSLGPSYDTSYIKSFRDNFVLTFVTSANSNIVGTSDSLGNDYDFATNLPTSFGLGFDYKWLTLELTSSFGNLGDPKKGETEATSFSFGLTMRKLWFRNFFSTHARLPPGKPQQSSIQGLIPKRITTHTGRM